MTKRMIPLLGVLLLVAGCPGGGEGAPQDPPPEVLAWRTIPSLTLTVGVSTTFDTRAYLDDPTDSATITLHPALPAGLQWNDGVISGTPADVAARADYTATATAGDETVVSAPFGIEVASQSSLSIAFERATPEQIGIHIPLPPGTPANATATVRYRRATEVDWRTGHPLLRIVPAWNLDDAPVRPVDAFAGTIFDLSPGTAYDVEVTIAAPPGAPQVLRTVVSTRALPPASGAANVHATPLSDLQAVFNALKPGDVLELSAGVYVVDRLYLNVSGTANAPITIRGANRDLVVLRDADGGAVLQFQQASHVVVEDLTLEGTGVDSGVNASSAGVSFWSETRPEYVTFRRLVVRGVDVGIAAWSTVKSVLVYDCVLRGNNLWTQPLIETNLTWNDDGIRLPGEGNCAFENTLHGFGDSFAVNDGVLSAGVYFYRNLVTMTGDDACEGDYGTRNIAFYDNHITNCGTLLSLDPVWGGPFYCFRNVAVNTMRGPFKWNSQQSGFLVYNNTIVRTEGRTGWGWVQYNNGALRGWSFRNNILVYHGGTKLLALENWGNDPIDFTNNAWYPDGTVWWSNTGGSFTSLGQARDALPATTPLFGTSTKRHEGDLILPREPFASTIPLGATHLTEVTTYFLPTLASGSSARNAGVAIPNITDGFSGPAPDLGAVISGRAVPAWGASP
jgi:hypothetical protein